MEGEEEKTEEGGEFAALEGHSRLPHFAVFSRLPPHRNTSSTPVATRLSIARASLLPPPSRRARSFLDRTRINRGRT
ncbi:hypothetical protein N7532_010908 [Penicillium argentinense]|uniref:Uncharacterized protein n=1 Tax=Penicillium argentinense TaxID=1131581 RepID=A0A9W9EQG9_9EURO|nr:uncharacterized protein N7532_010908 [Penicillium argentinense]KAJ5086137.1 hypothetical protein N7532_010908 [Penicillium argentinense]